MYVRWSVPALEDAKGIVRHIQEESPDAAQKVAQAILDGVDRLLTFPSMGRRAAREGTRELVIEPYIIIYRILPECVELLRIWHGAQDWQY